MPFLVVLLQKGCARVVQQHAEKPGEARAQS